MHYRLPLPGIRKCVDYQNPLGVVTRGLYLVDTLCLSADQPPPSIAFRLTASATVGLAEIAAVESADEEITLVLLDSIGEICEGRIIRSTADGPLHLGTCVTKGAQVYAVDVGRPLIQVILKDFHAETDQHESSPVSGPAKLPSTVCLDL